MNKMKESDIQKQILEFLKAQNRPFSANEIFSSVLPDTGKKAKARALDMLISEGKAKEEVRGKQKVYSVIQNEFPFSTDEALQMLEFAMIELSNSYRAMQNTVKKIEKEATEDSNSHLATDKAKPDFANLKSSLSMLGAEMKKMHSHYAKFQACKSQNVTPDKEKHVESLSQSGAMANNIDGILEVYPESENQLAEEMGIETTEDKL